MLVLALDPLLVLRIRCFFFFLSYVSSLSHPLSDTNMIRNEIELGLPWQLFTDAGQYVIRFGDADSSPKDGVASTVSTTGSIFGYPFSCPLQFISHSFDANLDRRTGSCQTTNSG